MSLWFSPGLAYSIILAIISASLAAPVAGAGLAAAPVLGSSAETELMRSPTQSAQVEKIVLSFMAAILCRHLVKGQANLAGKGARED